MGILDIIDGSLVQFWYSPAKSEERQLEIPSQADFQDKTPPPPREKFPPRLGLGPARTFFKFQKFSEILKKISIIHLQLLSDEDPPTPKMTHPVNLCIQATCTLANF